MLGFILNMITDEATEHDQKAAREYDAENRKIVEKTKKRNSAITGATGIGVLGALALYGISKLSDDGKKDETKDNKDKKALQPGS